MPGSHPRLSWSNLLRRTSHNLHIFFCLVSANYLKARRLDRLLASCIISCFVRKSELLGIVFSFRHTISSYRRLQSGDPSNFHSRNMDHFRSPQAANPTTLSISSPRSLRPREDPQPVTPQFYPTPHTPQTFYAPPYSPESRTEDELDQSPPVDYVERGRTEQDPPQGTSSGRRIGLMSGLTNGLRRLPGAFVKHHSRESLHAQYQAEAEAVAARYSRRYSSRSTSTVNLLRPHIDIPQKPLLR